MKLLQFFALGALLFAAKALLPDPGALRTEPIRISAAQVERLRAEWAAETRRYPTAEELDASLRRHADEEMLLREALRLGLDRSDPVVRSRLVQNLRFVHRDPAADEGAMFAEALALGMGHRDLVARRRLVQAMEERLATGVAVRDDEVRAYVAAHPERYARPARISFRQVFLSADRHRGDLDAAAAAIRARLAAVPVAQGLALGEPFLLGQAFTAQAPADLARNFGAEFAEQLARQPPGRWSGALRSAYGVHFVHVDAVEPAAVADAAAVQGQAYYALLEQREREVVREKVAQLRERYPVEVESLSVAMVVAP